MPINNIDIADIFNQIADLLEILGENPFRIRAYRNASRTVASFSKNISDMIAANEDLTQFPNIGKDLAGKINEIVETGTLQFLETIKKRLPAELIKLMNIPGLGPKKVAKLYKQLGVTSIDRLKAAIQSKKIFELEGFGEKTARNILEEIDRLQQKESERFIISIARQYADSIVDYLEKAPGIKDISIAGSLRRCRETVRDIDILVTCENSEKVMEHFVNYDQIQKVLSKGKTKSALLLRSNLQVDLRAVLHTSFGSALLYFTGSREHNIELRKIAIKKKYKLNEYGVFKDDRQIAGKKEEDVYKSLGLPYIPPELRENRGEIEAAQNNSLPNLIAVEDINGDLHTHTNYTDGQSSIDQMARAAKKLGYSYIAITDHTQRTAVAGGLKPHDLKRQLSDINKISIKGIAILKGSEIDILEDGSLDLPDDLLKQLDIRVCSVHHNFNFSKQKQTERIIRAMDNPYFNILAHPTGRIINKRDPYNIDIEKIMLAAKERNCVL